MTSQPVRTYTRLAVAIVAAGVIVAAALLVTPTSSKTVTSTVPEITTTTQTTTVTTIQTAQTTSSFVSPPCEPGGEFGPFGLRIIFDSNQSLVVGAQVKATNQPATVSCNGSPPYPLTEQTTVSFTTNHTEWYYLDTGLDAGFSIVVTYLGQNYSLNASLHVQSAYCATLFIPSGKTNSTGTEFQTSCS